MNEKIDLDGKLLIAMPGIGDQNFDKSVIYMCSHSEDGAMGIIVNKPSIDLKLSDSNHCYLLVIYHLTLKLEPLIYQNLLLWYTMLGESSVV